MIKIGMLIADRYEILEKVGNGGMADVYKAKDHTLNRYVAVKVLKQEFSENANFVSKFRVEAQAAAGLMHPNIVNVYDVGEEKGIYYIVMELVDGITLKNYIEKRGRLGYKEAVTIAIQVSMGIDAAHRNHIIHRDIKPQNIIISKEGKVKVTDFGIAKAATSDTITTNVMGSVHYTSPEQARGGFSDEKSDVYSLGVTLFEMLTGEVPFDGETTVAIAIKHIQKEMPSPREINPDIPYSVEQIVLKCCEKSPDRRYQNMRELLADLKRAIGDPDGDFVNRYDPNKKDVTKILSEDEIKQIKKSVKEKAGEEAEKYDAEEDQEQGSGNGSNESKRRRKGVRIVDEPEDDEYDSEYDEDFDDEEEEERENSMDRIARILIILAVVIIGAIMAMIVGSRMGFLPGGRTPSDSGMSAEEEMVTMPAVVGLDVAAARNALVRQGLIPELISRGLKVAVFKNGGHFKPDMPGTDTYRFLEVGATGTLFFDDSQYQVSRKLLPPYEELFTQFPEADLLLVEGLRGTELPKLEIIKPDDERSPALGEEKVLGYIAKDAAYTSSKPVFDREDVKGIADFIMELYESGALEGAVL